MSDDPDYKVGYGKPPRHSQFLPGQSGFKGRKRRKAETQAQMIARVRDELVTVNGETMTKYELAVRSVIAQTIKSGKTRDLKILFELLSQYGAVPEVEAAAETKAAADKVFDTIMSAFDRSHGFDPRDSKALERLNQQEARLVISCPHCGPRLRENWSSEEYRDRQKRRGGSNIHECLLKGQ
jgi:Family of unknown function (DUF5681)